MSKAENVVFLWHRVNEGHVICPLYGGISENLLWEVPLMLINSVDVYLSQYRMCNITAR